MHNRVPVLDKNRQPLMPCHPARARQLLRRGKAAVFRRYPFVVILKDRECGAVQETRLKIAPGSKVTGLAVVAECARRGQAVLWAAELQHRGAAIRFRPSFLVIGPSRKAEAHPKYLTVIQKGDGYAYA